VKESFDRADVAVSSVVDVTEKVQRPPGELPYKILRHCTVTVPGRRGPSEVEINAPFSVEQLKSLFAAVGGNCPELPKAQGYGDHGFLCADAGSFYGIVGTKTVHVGAFFSVPDVEHVAKNIIASMR
jgi:hypothetical protein